MNLLLLTVNSLILQLFVVHVVNAGFFSSSIDKLKKKAKDAFKNKVKKGVTLNLWGYEQSEYPGSNNKYREENRAKWNDYYQCLNSQADNLNTQRTVTPEAILGFETSFVTMECKICLSPLERGSMDSVTWEWAAEKADSLFPVEYTEHILLSPEDRSLQIFNLNAEHTGQYICKLGQAVVAPYFLTVVNISETLMHEVHSPSAPKGPYSKEPEDIEFGLILDTEWGEWSACSKCDSVGRKHKLGYCTVYFKEPTRTSEYRKTLNRTRRSENDVTDIFKIFKFGIPCQSHVLPIKVRELPQVKTRKNEIMTGFCNIKCPVNKVFEVRDKNGRVIERADNSEGIYSLNQKLPPIEPPVERRLQYEAKGTDVVLECPGNINSDVPIQWQIGEKNLVAEKIAADSQGRIYISITDRIRINKAKISDSNIYSCWQLKELAGTIRLVVEKKFELNFNHSIMLFGLVVVLGTFLYVFLKIIANRDLTKTGSI